MDKKIETCYHITKDFIGLRKIIEIPIPGYKRKKKRMIVCRPCSIKMGGW